MVVVEPVVELMGQMTSEARPGVMEDHSEVVWY